MANIKSETRFSVADKLSFAGSLPVAYDQHSQENEIIREVTEPTSPDPYYPERQRFKKQDLMTQLEELQGNAALF